jgi:hypothetical protein
MRVVRVYPIVSTCCLLVVFISVCSPTALASYDVNKYWSSIPTGLDTDASDSLMCWAATGANVLTYTGWGIDDTTAPDPYNREYDVYHEFLANYPNERGSGTKAYDAYFDWHYPSSTPTVVQLYPDPADPDTFRTEMFNLKDQSYGLYLSINMGHAITMWDYEITAGGYRITVSDSDDGVNGTQTYDIVESGGYWRLQDFYGSDNWYIRRVDALAQRFTLIDPGLFLDKIQLYPSLWTQVQLPEQQITLYRYSPLAEVPLQFDGPYSIPAPSAVMLVLAGLTTLTGAARRRKGS